MTNLCKDCDIKICNNSFENCKYLKAHCYFCNDPIMEKRDFDVKFFYNHTWIGKPICDWCSEGLETNGQGTNHELRNQLGLEPIETKKGLDKWLNNPKNPL